jgi:hypothetical protein
MNNNFKSTKATIYRRIAGDGIFFKIIKEQGLHGKISLMPTELTQQIKEFIKGKQNFKMSKRYLVAYQQS